ncbi:MAG: energy transducer TonB [Acidobacteriaceae bacterium]
MLADPNSRPPRLKLQGPVLSVAVHAALFLAFALWAYRTPRIAPFRLPGTAKGLTLLTYYSPGSSKPSATDATVHSKRTKSARTESRKDVDTPTPPAPPRADAGTGNTTESGLGEGDIRIAMLQHFPYPHPDLSALAHGTRGDVILDAVIDEHGKITGLTLLKGLDPSVDQAVIATVRQWLFTPATKDGVPVVSEQEFHFHYERG